MKPHFVIPHRPDSRPRRQVRLGTLMLAVAAVAVVLAGVRFLGPAELLSLAVFLGLAAAIAGAFVAVVAAFFGLFMALAWLGFLMAAGAGRIARGFRRALTWRDDVP